MTREQLEAFNSMVIAISIVSVIIAIIVWFIFIIQSGTEQTRLKHETCMVETTYNVNQSKTVTEYCGSNKETLK